MLFERVLVPLDGSSLAENTLSQVRRILIHADAEVILAQAVPLSLVTEGHLHRVPAHLQQELDRHVEEARTYLEETGRRLSEQGARVRLVVRVGSPAETLLEIAREERVSLISMSTHGRTGLSRWVFGSVAEKVLRASPVPLLLVRSFGPDAEGRCVPVARDLRLVRILVPIDASDTSLQVIPVATEMARIFEAQLIVLNVCEGHPQCSMPVPQITRAYEKFREAGLTVEPVMKQGDPAEQILEICREHSADLIAMTTHGRSGVSRWMLGSVAEKVLRHATVPMLVVRGQEPRFKTSAPDMATEEARR